MSNGVRLLVMITTAPGRGQEQIDAYRRLAPLVRAEEGCLQYDLHQVRGEPDRFVLVEHWSSEDALAAHDSTPHMIDAAAVSASFRAASAEVIRLDPGPVN